MTQNSCFLEWLSRVELEYYNCIDIIIDDFMENTHN